MSYRDGRYRGTTNLLRKYLGDFLIASYLDVVLESGYDDSYVKEVEVIFSPVKFTIEMPTLFYSFIWFNWDLSLLLFSQEILFCSWNEFLVPAILYIGFHMKMLDFAGHLPNLVVSLIHIILFSP